MTSQPTAPFGAPDESWIIERLRKEAWDSVADWKVETGDDPFNDPAIWV
ncbi:MAG: hypothetical protein OXI08_11875 [Cyanobacteria bacterium MAG IRC4_bin_6]|nr:hypothetical protein [Cyanobacteria bacterium MAG IRC3_bin_20]MDE0648705.1 hypothetical protein [Cyanobacteria bacterium MAG IRC4_bin_6]